MPAEAAMVRVRVYVVLCAALAGCSTADSPTYAPPITVIVAPSPSPLVAQVEPKRRFARTPAVRPPPTSPRKSGTRKSLQNVAKIAALIVATSRASYYARGRPCACPDDMMRNGRRCGGRSAYSRPGGARPLCSLVDVTPEMIAQYRNTGSPQIAGR